MKNTIYLRRKSKLLLERKTQNQTLNITHIASLLKNISSLGYTLSGELVERVMTLSLDNLEKFNLKLVQDLQVMVGANIQYKPMYPNFPHQVMEMEEAELYINAMMHYLGRWFGVRILPNYDKEDRPELSGKVKLKLINLGTEDEFKEICVNLLGTKSSISETDKEDVEWFIKEYKNQVEDLIPEEIPHKENLAHLTKLLLEHTEKSALVLAKKIKTATDVLRVATALSDGDISLSTNTKFRSFKRSERRLLLGLLEQCNAITEDMLRHKKRWIRLGERLHPFEYQKQYPKTFDAFDILRNKKPFSTFNSKVEQLLVSKDIPKVTELLLSRPGEFARKLDHLLRISSDTKTVLDQFQKVADKVATTVLLQVLAHFKHRNEKNDLRIFFPKGNTAKAFSIENKLPNLDSSISEQVVKLCSEVLVKNFRNLPELGKTYLDEELKNYIVPFSQRSASKALRTIVRGSKLKIPEGKTIRFFIWWKEGIVNNVPTEEVDLDLSSVMYNENWEYMEHISYTNLKSDNYKSAHSGDITSAPNGACEFVDLDIESVIKHKGRYVVMSVNSFTDQPFITIPECYTGWMMREEPNSGEIFEPSTVQDKIDVTSDSTISIPLILDLVKREIIWADLALTSNPCWQNSVEGNQKGMVLIGQAITSLVKPNLHELFKLHIEARGTFVENAEDAETVFSVDQGITPFDTEEIMAGFL
ncbi:MAG: hypothetical protein ACI86H_002905 [bacterium]|jgi:hypothetical protein